MSAEARSLHPRVYPDSQEAELGAAQSRARPVDEWDRSDDLHSGRRTQPAGALDRVDPRGPCERSAGRALSRGAGNSRRHRRSESPAGTLEIRSEAPKEKLSRDAECRV